MISEARHLVLDGCIVDLWRSEATSPGGPTSLTPLEVRLLAYLGARPGAVVAGTELLREVWGYAPGVDTAALAIAVRRVRRKLGDGRSLRTVRGIGYRLDVSTPGSAAVRPLFVGRERDLAVLLDSAEPLVSLIGPPGVGKTRLARELGVAWAGREVWVSLRGRETRDEVVAAFAEALDLSTPPRSGAFAWLASALRHRDSTLWILDDAEAAVDVLDEVLVGGGLGSGSRLVVTSRVAPRSGVLHPVRPLDPPDAAALFVAEAGRADPGLRLDPDDPGIVRVVEALDGLPLAIELAAARMSVLSLAQLEERLLRRFALLRSVVTRDARHVSLQAAIEVSYGLLLPPQRTAFARCAVFRGGFELAAGGAVLDLGVDEALELLHALHRAALVMTRRSRIDGAPRFYLLDSLAEFAADKLSDEERAAAEIRHGAHYAELGSAASLRTLRGSTGFPWRDDRANLVAACHRAISRGAGDVAATTATAAWAMTRWSGPLESGLDLMEAARQVPGLSATRSGPLSLFLGEAYRIAGRFDRALGHLEAGLAEARETGNRQTEADLLREIGVVELRRSDLEEARGRFAAALGIYRAIDDRSGVASTLHQIAHVHQHEGRLDEARAGFEEVLALHREAGDPRLEAWALGDLATVLGFQGRLAEAHELELSSLAMHRVAGDRLNVGISMSNLGLLQHRRGELDDAERWYEAALAEYREVGYRRGVPATTSNLATLHQERGRIDEARALYQTALVGSREIGDRQGEAIVLGSVGALDRDQGRLDEAQRGIEAAISILREIGVQRDEGSFLGQLAALHLRRGRPDEASRCLDLGEALLRQVADPAELAALLCTRARWAHLTGVRDAAWAALAEARRLAAEVGVGPGSTLDREIEEVRALLRAPRSRP